MKYRCLSFSRSTLVFCFALLALLLSLSPGHIQAIQIVGRRSGVEEKVVAVGSAGRYTGFDLAIDGALVAPVRFTSHGLITAQSVKKIYTASGIELKFVGLVAQRKSGVSLADSSVSVILRRDRFPLVEFDLKLAHFNPAQWQATIGKQPFHFLTLSMPTAKVWHHRGWLNATPLADPFPLLQDVHAGTPELSAFPYNREWSTTPPLSAHPLPVIGLWDPDSRKHLYIGWDFQESRLTDNSEKDIATGYCNRIVTGTPPTSTKVGLPVSMEDREGRDKFVALVYPHGGTGYQQLIYPKGGERLASRAALVYNTKLTSERDPNRFLWRTWWSDPFIRSRLPQVPRSIDLSWIPDPMHLKDIPGAPDGSLFAGVEGPFQIPGSRQVSGWTWHNESAARPPLVRGDTERITQIEHDAAELMNTVKRFKSDGEDCAYWEKPFEGRWTDAWGGPPVTTLHNANGWAAARLLLDLYNDPKTVDRSYLPIIEGVFNWTRQVVWTRNEFADVPSSPFAIGGTLATAFLWDYYFTFRTDPDPAYVQRALLAREMAISFTYRYLNMWGSDSIRNDALDSAFLWEPNSGRDWTGAACSNEVVWNLDTVAQTAVHTGDPTLLWALQGTLSRWHQMFQDVYRPTLSGYLPAEMTEGYGLAPGNPYGYPGGRARYGFGGPLLLMDPVGDSSVRIVAGEKAAIAFDRGGGITTLSKYTCASPGDFACTLKSNLSNFSATVTYPFGDLNTREVALVHPDGTRTILSPGNGITRSSNALWSFVVSGLNSGDTVLVGAGNIHGRALTVAPAATLPDVGFSREFTLPFRSVKIETGEAWDINWKHNNTLAGLSPGVRWVNGAPFQLDPTRSIRLTGAARKLPDQTAKTRSLYLLYTSYSDQRPAAPVVTLDNGSPARTVCSDGLAWQAWPPALTARVLMAAYELPAGIRPTYVSGSNTAVLAITVSPDAVSAPELAALKSAKISGDALLESDRFSAKLQGLAAQLPANVVAIIPTDSTASPANLLIGRGGLRLKMQEISPQRLVNRDQFRADTTPIALYLGNEDYMRTVASPGDGEEALHRFLLDGGTLVLMSNQPYPLYYGMGPGGEYKPNPILPRLGLPLDNAIETAPPGKLTVHLNQGQQLLAQLPVSFPYSEGDVRLRTVIKAGIPAGSDYTGLYSVASSDGKQYGDAAGMVTLPPGPTGARGRILYISNVLVRDPTNGRQIVEAVLRWMVKEANNRK